jgi:tetratricopeptide (TPR) repeat protein
MSLADAIQLGYQHLTANRFAEAEMVAQQVLAVFPEQPRATHYLAIAQHQQGRVAEAIPNYQRAIELDAADAEPCCNLAEAYRAQHRYDEAIAVARQAIERAPGFAVGYTNLGVALNYKGQHAEAETALRQALAINSQDPNTYNALGISFQSRRFRDEALQCYQYSLQLMPNAPGTLNNYATLLQEMNRHEEAVEAYKQVIALNPNASETYSNLCNALRALERNDEAVAVGKRAVELAPDRPEAVINLASAIQGIGQLHEAIDLLVPILEKFPTHVEGLNQLGNAYHRLGDLDKAIEIYRKTLAIKPDANEIRSNLALACEKSGHHSEARTEYEAIIAVDPNNNEVRFNYGLLLLHAGDLPNGFKEFEYRWNCVGFRKERRYLNFPYWDGSDLTGKTILIHAEQGLGDSIQFVRYLKVIEERYHPARILFECQPELGRLLADCSGVSHFFVRGEQSPPFDVQCPLLSVPRVMGTTVETIPGGVPYLKADPARVERWRNRWREQGSSPAELRVGLVWAGSPKHHEDRFRSIPLAMFAPVADIPGVKLVSLQKGNMAMQTANAPFAIENLDPEIESWFDTAAILETLDLLITCDTGPAHLAGAMGRPVWTLSHFPGEWRWLQVRTDSPWYPSMRLFRQKKRGEWAGPIAEVAAALRERKEARERAS